MSSRGLRVELSPSPRLAFVLILAHALAGASVLAALPGRAGSAVALLILLLGVASAWRTALLRSRSAVRALVLGEGGTVALELAGGTTVFAEVAPRRYVSRLLVTLPLRRPRRTLLVTADMLSSEAFRRLRLWALWGRVPGVAGQQLPA